MEYMDKEFITSKAADVYPGAAVDKADDNKVDPALVKERTKVLENNPRDNDLDE